MIIEYIAWLALALIALILSEVAVRKNNSFAGIFMGIVFGLLMSMAIVSFIKLMN